MPRFRLGPAALGSAVLALLLLYGAPAAHADTITLDFDDVDALSEYEDLGVTFSTNASILDLGAWSSVTTSASGGAYSAPNVLQFGNAGGVKGNIYFDVAQTAVSIWALSGPGPDNLTKGGYIKAYDADDNLIDSDTFDTTVQYQLLSVAGTGIVRLETYSAYVNNDAWDDLTFAKPVPEPGSLALLGLGLAGLAVHRRRRRAAG